MYMYVMYIQLADCYEGIYKGIGIVQKGKGMLAKLAMTCEFFGRALRPTWKGTWPLATVAMVKIEA